MLKFKTVDITEMDKVAGMVMHKKVEFSTPYFYIGISVVQMEDSGRRWPWLVVLNNERDRSVFLGQTYQCFTEEEALEKAESCWLDIKNGLIAYLNKH